MKDKIPFYDVANKFFVGAIFTILLFVIVFDKTSLIHNYYRYSIVLKEWSAIVSAVLLVLMYEIGFIINRASSITIAPVLEKTKIWRRDQYKLDVSEIKKENDTFNAMITELVLIRSHILAYFILAIISLFCQKYIFAGGLAVIIVVFVFSGKSHNDRINIIRKDYVDKQNKLKE